MDDIPQSGVVDDQMMDQLLDRTWMLSPEEQQQQQFDSDKPAPKQPARGKGRGKRSAPPPAVEQKPTEDDSAVAASASGREVQTGLPYPAQGVGYEVVQALQDSSLLSNVN